MIAHKLLCERRAMTSLMPLANPNERTMLLQGDPTFVAIDALCSQFAKDFATRTDYGTRDWLQAIVPGESESRSSRRGAPLNPDVDPDCLYA